MIDIIILIGNFIFDYNGTGADKGHIRNRHRVIAYLDKRFD